MWYTATRMVTLIYCCGSVNYIIALDNCLTVSSTIGLTHILRLSNTQQKYMLQTQNKCM